MPKTFLWHDYETFGRDPSRERPVQFAAIRTDENLEEIEDGTMIYCRQTPDYLPDPGSCRVHGVLPQTANEKGLSEWEFANTIHALMATPNTCTVGYNNIRFDDEFTRQLLFRNLFDPYSREWCNNNSRWDLIDVVRLTRALRPKGIEWPHDADGKPTNKLELITDANGIEHGDAHDALADVRATVAVAKLIKEKQPELFFKAISTSNKSWVQTHLDVNRSLSFLHISGMYPATQGHMAMVTPIVKHPTNRNGVIVYDLRHDPSDLIELPEDELRERIFTAKKDLPEGVKRISVKTVHANRCPILVSPNRLDDRTALRWQLDQSLCEKHRKMLLAEKANVAKKLKTVFKQPDHPKMDDPDLTLYSGTFASDSDRKTMISLQKEIADGRHSTIDEYHFEDSRLNELLFRLRARNWPQNLDNSDNERWQSLCHQRVHKGQDGFRSISQYRELVKELKNEATTATEIDLTKKLINYGEEVAEYSKH